MKLQLIEWHDSCAVDGWQATNDSFPDLTLCQTVGWLVGEDEASVKLACSISVPGEKHDDQVGGIWVIPRACITKRRTLRA